MCTERWIVAGIDDNGDEQAQWHNTQSANTLVQQLAHKDQGILR